MSAALAWFLGTRIGRYTAAAGAIALAAAIAILKLLAMGRAQERAREAKARLEAIQQRKTTDAAVDHLSPGDLDRELDRWMRDKPR